MRIVLKSLSLIVVLFVIGLALMPATFRWNWLRTPLSHWVSAQIGRELSIRGNLVLDLSWQPRIRMGGLCLANLPGNQYPLFAEVEALDVYIDLRSLLQGRWVLPALSLTNPIVHLERASDGTPNWIFGNVGQSRGVQRGGTAVASHFTIDKMTLQNGRITFSDPNAAIEVTAHVTEQPSTEDWRTLILHGSGLVQGGQAEIELRTASLSILLGSGQSFALEGCFTLGNTHGCWAGAIASPWTLQGTELELELSGPSPAALFPITQVVFPALPPYHFAGHFSQKGSRWLIQNLQGSVGNSDFAGAVTWEGATKRPRVEGHLQSHHLDLKDLGIGQPVAPPPTTGQAVRTATLAATQPAPVAIDADLDFQGDQVVMPVVIQEVQTHLHVKDGQIRLEPFDCELAGGRVAATVGMDTQHHPTPITLDAHFRALDLKHLFATLGILQQNNGSLTGQMQFHSDGGNSVEQLLAHAEGTALFAVAHGQLDSLLLALARLDLTKTLTSLLFLDNSVELRCAVAGVRAHGGVLTIAPLVIDTTSTKVTGGGTVDLRKEVLDLTFEPHPKDLSLLSAHSPLRVTGGFQSPEVRPEVGPLGGRMAAAAALGVLVGPVGAIMPFIEPGIGEDHDCQDLVRGVNTHALDPLKPVPP